MCLIAVAYGVHPRYPLILLANRDEFLARPAEPAHFWPDRTHLLAGRDLRAGGTWLGVSTNGRIAALTNYRDLRRTEPDGPSRGELVILALEERLDQVDTRIHKGFNLLYGTFDKVMVHSNVTGETVPLQPGIHGLSNHLLNTPWPKVERAKTSMAQVIASEEPDTEALFTLMADRTQAEDQHLPDTGVGLAWEKVLSPLFIATEGYGTRCTTLVMVDHEGWVTFEERGHTPMHRIRERFRVVTDRTS